MVTYLKENIQLFLILAVIIIIGIFGGPLVYVIVPLSIIQMIRKGMFEELLISYFFILVLSDSLMDYLSFAKNVKNIFAAILAIHFFFRTFEFNPRNNLYKLYVPFFLFAVFTLCTSIYEPFFFTSVQKTFSYFISFLIVPHYVEKIYYEKGKLFFKRFILFCFSLLLLGFVFKFIAHDIAYLETGRYRGVMGNPNGLGIFAFLLCILFFTLNTIFPDLFSKNERVYIYIAIFLSVLMTNSRNAIIGITIFLIFQKFYNKYPFLGFILFLLTVYLSEIITTNMLQIVLQLNLGKYFRVKTLEDASGRYIAWEFAWKQIQNNFFVGKGFAYNEYYMRQHYRELARLGHQGGIHNSFLTFWMDQGLIGLIIFLRSFILMFTLAAKKIKFAFPIMFAISFTAIFESWMVGSLSAYAFLAMFIFTLITSDEIKEEERVVEKPEFQQLALN